MLIFLIGLLLHRPDHGVKRSASFLLCTGKGDAWVLHNGRASRLESGVDVRLVRAQGKTFVVNPWALSWNSSNQTFERLSEREAEAQFGASAEPIAAGATPNGMLTLIAKATPAGIDIVDPHNSRPPTHIKIPAWENLDVAWSADSKYLAVSVLETASPRSGEENPPFTLYVFDTRAGKLQRIGAGYGPRWAKDGSLFVIDGGSFGGKSIARFRLLARGKISKQTVLRNGRFVGFDLSPDDKQIATVGWRNTDSDSYELVQVWTRDGTFQHTVFSQKAIGKSLALPLPVYWLP